MLLFIQHICQSFLQGFLCRKGTNHGHSINRFTKQGVDRTAASRIKSLQFTIGNREECLFMHVVQNHGNHKEHKHGRHSRNHGNGGNDTKDGSQIHPTCFYEFFVDRVDILAESIDKSANRSGVKEGHWCSHDRSKHVSEHGLGCFQRNECEEETPNQVNDSHTEIDQGIHAQVIVLTFTRARIGPVSQPPVRYHTHTCV
mmetsp:Transcript_33416/g.80895  ORF Transcript_33416/g.80895 Transcript_33416/m.80895 type:complete len:200 (+) Transcript_33416:1203-1802(+)